MKYDKEELKKFMSEIITSDVTLKDVPDLIEKSYIAGMKKVDEKYKKAISEASKEVGMNADLFFKVVLKHLD